MKKERVFVFAAIFITLFSSVFVSAISDLNNDGVINRTDFSLLASVYRTNNATFDRNNDGVVNLFDLVSVARTTDLTAPVISNANPSGSLSSGTTSVNMNVTTNEVATCKYSLTNISFATMSNNFSNTGGTTHTTTISGLTSGSSYTYYVRCRDGPGSSNLGSTTVSFSVASGGGGSPTSYLNVNRPNGLTTILEDDFNYTLTTGDSSALLSEFIAGGGWTSDTAIWVASHISSVQMSNTPNSGDGVKYVVRPAQPIGTAGSGVLTLRKSLGGTYNKVYVYVATYYESGFPHNNNSEKLVYFQDSGGSRIFEHSFRDEVLNNIAQNSSDCGIDSHSWANLLPCGSGGTNPETEFPADGVWTQYEVFLDASTGTIKWWTDGVQRANHTGRTMLPYTRVLLDWTWGGGNGGYVGGKPSAEARRVDYILVAAGN